MSNLPRIAFAGRSNVGKSSLLNRLIGRKNLARTSSTPGRTQVINFFSVSDTYLFVDLPGYGFARVPAAVRALWGPMIEEFLRDDKTLRLTVAVVDSRHRPGELDQRMIEWMAGHDIPFQVVATKVDKLSVRQRSRSLTQIEESLKVTKVIPFSAVTGEGKKEVWNLIERVQLRS